MVDSKHDRRGPPPATPGRLEASALFYLQRFASSAENLRRVLERRVERSARQHGTDRAAGRAAVAALVLRFQAAGLLDDRGYAEARAASLHRRGRSLNAIRRGLAAKGVGAEHAAAATAALAATIAEPDLAAAISLARRRRLGPWRVAGERSASRVKDLAVLGRAGFDYATARQVIDAPSSAALEEPA
jgi:regulatory protein